MILSKDTIDEFLLDLNEANELNQTIRLEVILNTLLTVVRIKQREDYE